MENDLLTPDELVERWKGAVSVRTLDQWRYLGKGPSSIKIGNKVRYKLADVVAWENRDPGK
jgi:hypothetical protein